MINKGEGAEVLVRAVRLVVHRRTLTNAWLDAAATIMAVHHRGLPIGGWGEKNTASSRRDPNVSSHAGRT
jgi:hypothetical protein